MNQFSRTAYSLMTKAMIKAMQTEERDNQYSYPIRTEEPDHNLFRETKCGCLSNSCRKLREVRTNIKLS